MAEEKSEPIPMRDRKLPQLLPKDSYSQPGSLLESAMTPSNAYHYDQLISYSVDNTAGAPYHSPLHHEAPLSAPSEHCMPFPPAEQCTNGAAYLLRPAHIPVLAPAPLNTFSLPNQRPVHGIHGRKAPRAQQVRYTSTDSQKDKAALEVGLHSC